MPKTKKQLGKMSRDKGGRGERELVKYLVGLGYKEAYRSKQRKGANDSSDIIVPELPHVYVECKRVEGIDLGTKILSKAVEKSRNDAGPDKAVAVFWRRNGQKWRMTYTNTDCVNVTVCGDEDIEAILNNL